MTEALALGRRWYATDSTALAQVGGYYGDNQAMLGHYATAETLLLGAYRAGMTDPAVPPPQRVQARMRLARLYEAWGKPDQAAAWRRPAASPGQPP